MNKTTCFKQMISDEEILVLPGAYDALSAKIIEQAGFKAVTLGGYPASASLLAKPDVSLLTLTEMVDHLRRIVEAVDIPVFGDGDTGHGNVTNVARTIRLFENAGAAGLFIEDQVFPKRCGHMEGKQVISAEEMCAKIKAAVDARRDPDLVVMARTDALAVQGLEAAIDRGNRYQEAGADLIFIEAPQSIEDMRRITKGVSAPLLANMIEGGKTPILSAKELQAIGYSVVAFPLSTLYAAAWALKEVMTKLATEGSSKNCLGQMIAFENFNHIVGLDAIRNRETFYCKDLFESLQTKDKS